MSPSLSHTLPPADAGALLTGAVLDIDLGAIQRNWLSLDQVAPKTKIGACVKADAYGLGVAHVAPALANQGCEQFFVADPQEGIALRGILPGADIYIMDGVFEDALAAYKTYRLIPCLKSLRDIDLWCGTEMRSHPAALHVDTGMHRLGVSHKDLASAKQQLDATSTSPVLLMSHLACADDPEHNQNNIQLAAFKKVQALFPDTPTSFANSAGLFLGVDYQGDIARPGISLYGASPFLEKKSPFEPVVGLRGRVLQIQDVPAGQGVGYGASYVTTRNSRIAVMGFGYGDGLFRHIGRSNIPPVTSDQDAGSRIGVFFGDVKAPIVGRLSMDQLTVDVSHIPESVAIAVSYTHLTLPTTSRV
ncbi:MAG: alanine racemase, partial [Parvibaculaceae bacterium]|nr:alanine racemase [Parvibaculaceae bacterium]